jgi:two-component system response regulator FixJ
MPERGRADYRTKVLHRISKNAKCRSHCERSAYTPRQRPNDIWGELDRPAICGKVSGDLAIVPSKPLRSSLSNPPHVLVCVADDDESIRRSLSRLFRSARLPSETFASAQAYLDRATHDRPSCLVLDVQLPGLDGLELQQALAEREEQIVFITGHGDVPMCTQAMKAGAADFLTKPVDDKALLAAVSRALERSAEIRKTKAERALARAKLDRLTPREFEVLQRVIAGSLNKQIAAELGAAEKTVKVHRGRVMEKMGVTSVAELVRLTQMAGVAPSATRIRWRAGASGVTEVPAASGLHP